MGRLVRLSLISFPLSFSLSLLFSLSHLWAYIPTVTSTGVGIRWQSPVKLQINGNPTNQSSMTSEQFYHAVVMGLQRWKAASSGMIDFDYWQGTDSEHFPTQSNFDGISSIYFTSQVKEETQLSPNVLGLTQVWYNTDTGVILETDIALNDRDFYFTMNPTDTSGYGGENARFTQGKNNVYIQNVITHEMGHALGLSHSGGLQSTMLFMESPEQAHLGCDEMTAIHALYPSPSSDPVQRGSLIGTVVSEAGNPIFGAHILAVSQQRGTVLATAITDQAGKFYINALEPGSYFLIAEPFFAGPQALPGYFSQINSSICPNQTPFSRSFLTQADGYTLIEVGILPSGVTPAPTLTLRCNPSGGAAILSSSASPTSNREIHFNQGHFAFVDKIDSSNSPGNNSNNNSRNSNNVPTPHDDGLRTTTYPLHEVSGYLKVNLIGYGLYSPIRPTLHLLNSDGLEVPAQIHDPVYQGDSGYVNYDSQLEVENLPLGDYRLQVTGKRLGPNHFPAGSISLDTVPFWIVSGTLDRPPLPLQSVIPNNARCRMSEDFPAYSSPPGPPPHHHSPSSKSEGSGFCGTLQNHNENKRSNAQSNSDSPSASASLILSWFLPWIFMSMASRAAILLHRSMGTANLKG